MARWSGPGFPELRVRQYLFGRLELFTVRRLLFLDLLPALSPPIEIDWFGDVVVSPELTSFELVLSIGRGAQENEWYPPEPRGDVVQALQHFEAGHSRHADVAQY
jgi:hypothetical protein